MQIKILSCIAVLSLMSTSAFATHAYRSQVCKSASHELVYKGNYPIGGDYGMKLIGQEDDVVALPLFDSETENTLENASVLFEEVSSKKISESATESDCGFEHSSWVSEVEIQIKGITNDASKKLSLKSGDKMTVVCEESFDVPDGSECK